MASPYKIHLDSYDGPLDLLLDLIKWIEPIRARREEFAAHPDKVLRIIDEGSVKARDVAQKTMARVREAVFGWQSKRAEIAAPRMVEKN